MTIVVLINGPRGVGKDTAALAIAGGTLRINYATLSVMRVFKEETLDLFKIPAVQLPFWEGIKDVSCMEFDGDSFREVLISRANELRAKDQWHFARRWAERAKTIDADVILVPDVRFFEEFIMACDAVGGANVYLLRVFRPGHDWTGDVGGYIRTDMAVFGNSEMSIINDMDEAYYKLEASVFVNGWIKRKLGATK